MRRTIRTVTACSLCFPTSVLAQDWGWPFGPTHPAHHRAAYRHVAAHKADPTAVAEVPLPVPRPHFPGDQAATGATASPAEVASRQPAITGPRATGAAATARPEPAKAPQQTNRADKGAPAGAAVSSPQAQPTAGRPPVAGSGATTASVPRQPADDPSCFDRLRARKVEVERADIGPQPDARCTVVEPVRLLGIALQDGSTVGLPDRPTIACTTADAFSGYVHDLMAPLAKGSFGAALAAVWTGPGLECRARDHIFGAKLSAHGQGLAVDVAQIRLADGRTIEVGTPRSEVETAFETAARAGACGYFHTVLGPGSDSYHRTHWHFDLLVRGKDGDGKYCK